MKNCKIFFLSFLFVLKFAYFTPFASAQNLFDSIHSEMYAHYLFANHEYELASQEFERILFMTDYTNDSLKWLCVKSIRLSGNPQSAEKRIGNFYPTNNFPNALLSKEYLKILFEEKKYGLAQKDLFHLEKLDSTDRSVFYLSSLLLTKQYKKAIEIVDSTPASNITVAQFKPIIASQKSMSFKKPWLAGTFSAIIPGLGQTYAGNWKDGVFALIFTGSSAFQAYRGFHKAGIGSPFGWIFTAIGSAFYAANIYGAAKAANKYNFLNHVKISIQVDALLDNYYH